MGGLFFVILAIPRTLGVNGRRCVKDSKSYQPAW
ncbi:unnamed protein product [Linum tenue]|uniref:Uncharacterized protein n=1 Tax=Linum tenue TaxID=586396 RepID=A0AAV0LVH3_9ROSI|nr:unnamed protein product [Linum tenue]